MKTIAACTQTNVGESYIIEQQKMKKNTKGGTKKKWNSTTPINNLQGPQPWKDEMVGGSNKMEEVALQSMNAPPHIPQSKVK